MTMTKNTNISILKLIIYVQEKFILLEVFNYYKNRNSINLF